MQGSWQTTLAGIVTLFCGVGMIGWGASMIATGAPGSIQAGGVLVACGTGMLPVAYGLVKAKDYNVTNAAPASQVVERKVEKENENG